MEENEFWSVCAEIKEREEQALDTYITASKKISDEQNRPYREMALRSHDSIYLADNLQELIDKRDSSLLHIVYAEITGNAFADENKAIRNEIKTRETIVHTIRSDEETGIVCAGLMGLFAFFVGPLWGCLATAIGLTASIFCAFGAAKKRKEKAKADIELFSRILEKREQAVVYANEKIDELPQEERETVVTVRDRKNKYYAEMQKIRADIERIKAKMKVLAASFREIGCDSAGTTSKTTTSGSSGSSSSSGRNEIVDDYGRTQGYSEDGRLYDQKGNVTGYVDEYNRVYDSEHKRVGEVRSDGKIEKYR